MKNIIAYLSPEAKKILDSYKNCNVGIFDHARGVLPADVIHHKFFTICLFDKSTVFDDSSNSGKSVRSYKENQPKPFKVFTVLIRGSDDDSGYLLGVLKKFSVDGFLYKPFDSEKYQEFGTVKYNYTNIVVKLVEPYSFLKGGGRKY